VDGGVKMEENRRFEIPDMDPAKMKNRQWDALPVGRMDE
jgi:hypothetical protein